MPSNVETQKGKTCESNALSFLMVTGQEIAVQQEDPPYFGT